MHEADGRGCNLPEGNLVLRNSLTGHVEDRAQDSRVFQVRERLLNPNAVLHQHDGSADVLLAERGSDRFVRMRFRGDDDDPLEGVAFFKETRFYRSVDAVPFSI